MAATTWVLNEQYQWIKEIHSFGRITHCVGILVRGHPCPPKPHSRNLTEAIAWAKAFCAGVALRGCVFACVCAWIDVRLTHAQRPPLVTPWSIVTWPAQRGRVVNCCNRQGRVTRGLPPSRSK